MAKKMSRDAQIWQGILGINNPNLKERVMKDFYRRVKLASGKSILVNEFGVADVATVEGLIDPKVDGGAELAEYEAIPEVKNAAAVNKRRQLREFVKGGKS